MSTPIIPPTQPAKPGDDKKKDASEKDTKPASPELPKGADGATTLDKDVPLEGEILAFESLERIARMVAKEILDVGHADPAKRPIRIYVLDELTLRALEIQQASQLQTSHLKAVFVAVKKQSDQFKPKAERETGLELATFTAAVGAITSLAGLFRTDVSIRGSSYEPSQEAFLNSVTRYLLRMKPGIEIRNPNLLVYSPGSAEQASHKRILDRLNDLEQARFDAEASTEELSQRVLQLQFLLDPPKPKPAPTPEEAAAYSAELALKKPVLQASAKSMDQATARWAELQKQLDAVDSDHHSGLGLLARAEELLAWAQDTSYQTYFLAARCLSLRANFKTEKGLFTNLGGKNSLSYSGGATATYALFAADATVKTSGTHRYRSPYLRFTEEDAPTEAGNSFDDHFEALD